MQLTLRHQGQYATFHETQKASQPINLAALATGVMQLNLHQWLCGVAQGLGLPQPPRYAQGKRQFSSLAVPAGSPLELEIAPTASSGEENLFFIYGVITTVNGQTAFNFNLLKPGSHEAQQVQLSCIGAHSANTHVVPAQPASNEHALTTPGVEPGKDNIVFVTIPVHLRLGHQPKPVATQFLTKFTAATVREKPLHYACDMGLLLRNGGRFEAYGTPQITIISHLNARLSTFRISLSQVKVRDLEAFPPVAHNTVVKLSPGLEREPNNTLAELYQSRILSPQKPETFASSIVSYNPTLHRYLIEYDNRYIVEEDGSVLCQPPATSPLGGKYDYNNSQTLRPLVSTADFKKYFTAMMLIVFTGHNPPLAMYDTAKIAWAIHYPQQPMSISHIMPQLTPVIESTISAKAIEELKPADVSDAGTSSSTATFDLLKALCRSQTIDITPLRDNTTCEAGDYRDSILPK